MKLFDIYKWATGSMSEFARPFQENEALYQKAKLFWRGLESNVLIFILIFVVISILSAEIYYMKFSNTPGRRYHPKYWGLFYLITLLVVFLVTFGTGMLMLNTELQGSISIILNISYVNILYAAFVYLLTSVFCCRFQTTNAYRIF